MALFSQDALNPGVRKREVFGWAMYDFANSGYTTVVITAVFAAYFVGGIAGKARLGDLRLDGGAQHFLRHRDAHHAEHRRLCRPARGQEAPAGPVHRRLRDLAPRRWRCAGPGSGRAGDGADHRLQHLLFLWRVAHRRLPARARHGPTSLGKVSGWGWGFGYFGGMLALGLCLGYVIWAQGQGIQAERFVPVTMLITAALYGVGRPASPSALLRERAQPNPRRLAPKRDQGLAAAAAAHLRARPATSGLHVAAGLRGLLPGRRRRGDHAGRDLRGNR